MLDDNELLFDELYEKTKDCGRVQFINLLMEKERENQELKKQLEEKDDFINKLQGTKYRLDKYDYERTMQQKEFIEWLEQNIENEEYCYLAQNPSERCRKDVFEEVLSKYKEKTKYKWYKFDKNKLNRLIGVDN